jgi:hypothetical protein
VAEAFRSIWVIPRREFARRGLGKYRGELQPNVDLNIVLDAIYGPLYYRLLIGHEAITEEFADQIANLVLAGIMTQPQNGQKL